MNTYIKTSFTSWEGGLQHFGTKGMKWGQRRFQNEDGSLTSLGKERYGVGGKRSRLGIKHDLNKLDREQTTAKVRYDYNNNIATRKLARYKKKLDTYQKSGSASKNSQKIQKKIDKVEETYAKKAKEYKELLERSKSMTANIIRSANKKGMSIHSRDCVRSVNKGRNVAISAIGSAAGVGIGKLTGVGIGLTYSTYASGKHYRVKNDGLGVNTHRSGRHTRKMRY